MYRAKNTWNKKSLYEKVLNRLKKITNAIKLTNKNNKINDEIGIGP